MSIRLPSSWKKRAYKRVSDRDGSACALCSAAERTIWRKGGINSENWPDHGRYQIVHPSSNLELDHRTPLHMGGGNDDENLWLLCIGCHREKTAQEQSSRLKRLFAEARAA